MSCVVSFSSKGGGMFSVPCSSIRARPEGVCRREGRGFGYGEGGKVEERWTGIVGIVDVLMGGGEGWR